MPVMVIVADQSGIGKMENLKKETGPYSILMLATPSASMLWCPRPRLYSLAPQRLQCTAFWSWSSAMHSGQAWVLTLFGE